MRVAGRLIPEVPGGCLCALAPGLRVSIASHGCKPRAPSRAAQHHHYCSRDGETEVRRGGLRSEPVQDPERAIFWPPALSTCQLTAVVSLITSTEAVLCITELAQIQGQAGNAAGATLRLGTPKPHTKPMQLQASYFQKSASI